MKRRSLDGELLDVAHAAKFFGTTEKAIRSRVARRLVPHRRWGGRVVFLRDELIEFRARLAGVNVEQALANVAARGGTS